MRRFSAPDALSASRAMHDFALLGDGWYCVHARPTVVLSYLTGRVAACISTVNSYQNRYYFYGDDRQGTLLCALDEHAVGFAVDHSGGKQHGMRIVLSKVRARALRTPLRGVRLTIDRLGRRAGSSATRRETLPHSGSGIPISRCAVAVDRRQV